MRRESSSCKTADLEERVEELEFKVNKLQWIIEDLQSEMRSLREGSTTRDHTNTATGSPSPSVSETSLKSSVHDTRRSSVPMYGSQLAPNKRPIGVDEFPNTPVYGAVSDLKLSTAEWKSFFFVNKERTHLLVLNSAGKIILLPRDLSRMEKGSRKHQWSVKLHDSGNGVQFAFHRGGLTKKLVGVSMVDGCLMMQPNPETGSAFKLNSRHRMFSVLSMTFMPFDKELTDFCILRDTMEDKP